MPLTLRQNGTTAASLVTASWWNDFYNLLTGAMNDQTVYIRQNIILSSLGTAPPSGMTATVNGTGTLAAGTWNYVVSFVGANNIPNAWTPWSMASPPVSVVVPSPGNAAVVLASIPIGPSGTVARAIYRQLNGGSWTYVAYLADNVTTTYTDTGSSIAANTPPPGDNTSFGGRLDIYNPFLGSSNSNAYATNLVLSLLNNGSIVFAGNLNCTASGGMLFLLNNTQQASLTTSGLSVTGNVGASGNLTASGGVLCSGRFGVASAGDVLDGSGYDTFIKARGSSNLVHIQIGGSDVATFNSNGISLPSNTASIAVGSLLGIKTTGGTKLAEFKNNGNFVISGSTYYTTQSTYNYAAGGSFDGFDLAECYLLSRPYPRGTVVCPGDGGIFTRCTHDRCPAASIITTAPAFCVGTPDEGAGTQPVALSGRVLASTTHTVHAGELVCSDGNGGVRALSPGEEGFILGFALTDSKEGQVGIFLRPMYAKAEYETH